LRARKRQDPDTFYYSNKDGSGARVTRELVSELFLSLSNNIKHPDTLQFIAKTRIPNEREFYGLVIKSLFNSELGTKIGHVATEFQVTRDEVEDMAGNSSKGRVDLFFNYRNTSFLVELKLARIGLSRLGSESAVGEVETCPLVRITKAWEGAVDQLIKLNTKALETCLHTKVVKIPLVVFIYNDYCKEHSHSDWKDRAMNTHEFILNNIEDFIKNIESVAPEFELYSVLDKPIRTRRRKTILEGNNHNMTFYGFSIIASTLK